MQPDERRPEPAPDGWYLRNIDLRRAVLGALIRRRGEALTIGEIIEHLDVCDGLVLAARTRSETPAKRVGDLLRYQRRAGRVERVGRGTYRFVPGSLSTSTAWRCVNWRRVADQRVADSQRPC